MSDGAETVMNDTDGSSFCLSLSYIKIHNNTQMRDAKDKASDRDAGLNFEVGFLHGQVKLTY